MELVTSRSNMNRAYRRVVSNKGAGGIDRMTVDELAEWIRHNRENLLSALLDGSYRPQPVLGVKIPKPGGGTRQLGIPTVVDRLVQQAMAQILEPILEPEFSASSYGFRPGRGAHDALRQSSQYVASGLEYVVDIDLEKFFDTVNHDILISRLARHVKDKRFLRITRRFLQAGLMQEGVCIERKEGTPQGGPLSPILSNLLLDDLDKELERRNHKFCRYADDCNIYVGSQAASERVMKSATRFLEQKLKLRVNREKSAVGPSRTRKFLGYTVGEGGALHIAQESLRRFKTAVCRRTRRNSGRSLEDIISGLNRYLGGWQSYFRYESYPRRWSELDGWIRRKLRCYRLKQCKRIYSIACFLQGLGLCAKDAWRCAATGKGWWRRSLMWQANKAMGLKWFRDMGLKTLSDTNCCVTRP
jgi:RNA-directed DNA polymerase